MKIKTRLKRSLQSYLSAVLALGSGSAWAATSTYTTTTAGASSWVAPAGLTSVQVELWGGGVKVGYANASGATWNESVAAVCSFGGNLSLSSSSTFIDGGGVHTFSGTSIIQGTATSASIGQVAVTV